MKKLFAIVLLSALPLLAQDGWQKIIETTVRVPALGRYRLVLPPEIPEKIKVEIVAESEVSLTVQVLDTDPADPRDPHKLWFIHRETICEHPGGKTFATICAAYPDAELVIKDERTVMDVAADVLDARAKRENGNTNAMRSKTVTIRVFGRI